MLRNGAQMIHSSARDCVARRWGQRYAAVIRLRENAWNEFIPFLNYDPEIRTVNLLQQRDRYPSTPATGGRPRPAATSRPSRLSIKCLYLVTRSVDPTGNRRTRWTMR